jgi:signal transduction histidine kinase
MAADALLQLQAAAAAFQDGIRTANHLPDDFPKAEIAAAVQQIEAISGLEEDDLKVSIHLRDKLLSSIDSYVSSDELPTIDHLKRLHGELFIAVARYVTSAETTRIKAVAPKIQAGKLIAESADYQSSMQELLANVQTMIEGTDRANVIINQTINSRSFNFFQIKELKISFDGLRKAIMGINIELNTKFFDVSWLSEFIGWIDRNRKKVLQIFQEVGQGFIKSDAGKTLIALLDSAFDVVMAVGRFIQKVTRSAKFQKLLKSESEAESEEGNNKQSLAEALAANKAKTEFLMSMSHELRIPLNSLIGFTDALRGEIYGPIGDNRYKEYLEDMASSSNHLLAIVSDLLDISKIELGSHNLDEETFLIEEILAESVRIMQENLANSGLDLEYRSHVGNARIYADRRQITRAFLNLLSNAIKFTPTGGKISIISNLETDESLSITISDTGIGMSDDALEFVRQLSVPRATVRRSGAPGLGLPIASSIVAEHGGKLDFHSQLGVGTSVSMRLPETRVHR